jgi:hypothetical protein
MSDARVIGVEVKHVEFRCGKKTMSSDIEALRRLLNIVEALPRPMLVIGTQSALYAHFKLAKAVHREELNKTRLGSDPTRR